jgi:ribulose-phosphate 3-epimerase
MAIIIFINEYGGYNNMIISPSLLAANAGDYANEVKDIENAGAKFLHVDVMDGHFVPNLSFGPNILEGIRKTSDIYLDVHLMVENPMDFIEPFCKAGANAITVHAEAQGSLTQMCEKCKRLGAAFGVAVRPQTDLSEISDYLSDANILLIMSVNPGFGGQKFIPETIERISEAVELRDKLQANYLISVDGGINSETASQARKAGADILVAGSSVFGALERKTAIEQLMNK